MNIDNLVKLSMLSYVKFDIVFKIHFLVIQIAVFLT